MYLFREILHFHDYTTISYTVLLVGTVVQDAILQYRNNIKFTEIIFYVTEEVYLSSIPPTGL